MELHLDGEGSEAEVLGLLLRERDPALRFPYVPESHRGPFLSDLLFKGALRGRARMIYQGLIRSQGRAALGCIPGESKPDPLRQGAGGLDPSLEILANDVRCTHGATVGQVDEEQVFYLMARGLPSDEAERLIISGFFEPVLERIPSESLRALVTEAIEERRPADVKAATIERRPDFAAIRRDFPDPRAEGPRQAARVPRQRGDHAEAAPGDRRARATTTSTTTRTSTAASTRSPKRRPRRTRRRARRSRRFINARSERARSSSRATRPSRSTWWRTPGAASSSSPATRSSSRAMEHHSQPRPVAAPRRGRRGAKLRAHRDRRRRASSTCDDARPTDRGPARRSSRWRTCRTCSARSTRSRRSPQLAHRSGRVVLRRRRAERAAHAGGRAGAGLRLPGLLRPQDARADGHRRALRASASCSTRCRRSWAAAR